MQKGRATEAIPHLERAIAPGCPNQTLPTSCTKYWYMVRAYCELFIVYLGGGYKEKYKEVRYELCARSSNHPRWADPSRV